MRAESLITDVAALTPARLTNLLRQRGMLQQGVVEQIELLHKHVTWVSERCQLAIQYSADAVGPRLPQQLFLRLCNPTFAANSNHSTVFYQKLVPLMAENWTGKWPFAECLEAVWSPEQQRDHLLLLDLAETHFTVEDYVPPSAQQAEGLIDCFAALHAFWWQHPKLATFSPLLTGAALDRLEADYQTHLVRLATSEQNNLSATELDLVRQALTHWPQRRRERVLAGQGVTLVHRDPHPGNLFYPRNPVTHTFKLIDWQSWRADPGTDDLAYLIAFHWPTATRQTYEAPLLRRYHSRLVELGVQEYTWEDFTYDYRASIIRFVTIMVLHWQHTPNRTRLKTGLQAFVDWQCADIL